MTDIKSGRMLLERVLGPDGVNRMPLFNQLCDMNCDSALFISGLIFHSLTITYLPTHLSTSTCRTLLEGYH